jgi:hypothetical protein
MALDQSRLEELLGRFVEDFGATGFAATVVIGDKLGLYQALATGPATGPATSAELADRTSTHPRLVTEWLAAQAASGYVSYDPDGERFSLSEEQAFALAHEDGPMYLPGAFQVMVAAVKDEPKVTEAFRSGAGVGWHEHDPDLFAGTERFFRPGYAANLVSSWIPALDGVQGKLEAGALVADVGCGHGASTILMAQAWPRSSFVGFDYHQPSIERAQKAAAKAGVGRPLPLPGRHRQRLSGRRLRPGGGLRRTPRHGRPGRRGRPHLPDAGPGGDLPAGRALCRRPIGGQPDPGRAGLLCGLDAVVRAPLALGGGRPRPRGAGRRAAPAQSGDSSWVRRLPPRRPDALQPRLRSPPLR